MSEMSENKPFFRENFSPDCELWKWTGMKFNVKKVLDMKFSFQLNKSLNKKKFFTESAV